MKILLSLVLLFGITAASYSANSDELSPDKRKTLASDWLDTGKAFQTNQKLAKAKACFTYVNDLYPMGKDAEEARKILKDSFRLTISYNPDSQFKSYVKRANGFSDLKLKINNLLMALEIKQDKDILQKTAVAYKKLGDNAKAKEYLDKAIAAGLSKESIDSSLQGL